MKKILIFIFVFIIIAAPVLSLAQTNTSQGLIPCGRSLGPNVDLNTTNPCNFTDFLNLIDKIIKFILYYLVLPIAAIMFFYAGFKLVTSGGSSEAKTQAKNIFTNAVIGLAIAAGAWLIIKTILSILNPTAGAWSWIGF